MPDYTYGYRHKPRNTEYNGHKYTFADFKRVVSDDRHILSQTPTAGATNVICAPAAAKSGATTAQENLNIKHIYNEVISGLALDKDANLNTYFEFRNNNHVPWVEDPAPLSGRLIKKINESMENYLYATSHKYNKRARDTFLGGPPPKKAFRDYLPIARRAHHSAPPDTSRLKDLLTSGEALYPYWNSDIEQARPLANNAIELAIKANDRAIKDKRDKGDDPRLSDQEIDDIATRAIIADSARRSPDGVKLGMFNSVIRQSDVLTTVAAFILRLNSPLAGR